MVELFRYAYLGVGTVTMPIAVAGAASTLAVMVAGVVLFNRVERTFMDTV
jgi:lipopolysaccharide transport system permease protein